MAIDDEQAVIARLQHGDIGGLEPLVHTYHARAVRCAFLVVHDHGLALDVAQAAFMKAFEYIGHFDARRSFEPWFFKLVLREALKSARRAARFTAADQGVAGAEVLADPSLSPEQLFEQRELAQAVVAALAELPPAERVAIVQRYFLSLSESEMAAASGSPRGTIKWRLHAARNKLRLLLQPIRPESEVLK